MSIKLPKIKIYHILILVSLVFLALIVFAFFFLGNFLSLQDRLEKSDCVVVVSGGETMERTVEGVKLFKEEYAPCILFSGAAKKGNVSNAKTMRRQAIKERVPEDKIFIEEKATSTYENALFSKPILDKNNFKKIILVTSPYHQRRAYMNFKYVLGNGYKIINHSSPDSEWSANTWWKSQNINLSLEEFSRVIYLMITKKYDKQVR